MSLALDITIGALLFVAGCATGFAVRLRSVSLRICKRYVGVAQFGARCSMCAHLWEEHRDGKTRSSALARREILSNDETVVSRDAFRRGED